MRSTIAKVVWCDDGLLVRSMTKSNVITLDSVVYLCYLHYIIVQSGKKRRKERQTLVDWAFNGISRPLEVLGYVPTYLRTICNYITMDWNVAKTSYVGRLGGQWPSNRDFSSPVLRSIGGWWRRSADLTCFHFSNSKVKFVCKFLGWEVWGYLWTYN